MELPRLDRSQLRSYTAGRGSAARAGVTGGRAGLTQGLTLSFPMSLGLLLSLFRNANIKHIAS